MKSKLTWMLTPLLVLCMSFSFAQEKSISGDVTDQNGLAFTWCSCRDRRNYRPVHKPILTGTIVYLPQ